MISMLERRRRMLGDIDFRECVGIEIGALHSPVVPRSEGRIIYVDYAPAEELRQSSNTLVLIQLPWSTSM